MANDAQLAQAREQVKKSLDQLLAMPIKEAALRNELGGMNFGPAVPAIERTLGLFKMLDGVSLDFVSQTRLNSLKQMIDGVIEQFKQIQAFTLSVDNPKAQRDNIVSNLEGQYSNWFEQVYPLIGFAIRSTTDFSALERDLRQKIAQSEVTAKELAEKQQAAVDQAQQALAAIQKAAAEAGVSREAVYFAQEADDHEKTARAWLLATIGTAGLTVIWGLIVLFVFSVPANETPAQVIHQTVAKLIVLGGLSYALVWCGRNYAASRHNFVINRHRRNALSTFETFVKASSSDDVKDAVLLQATTSIFAAQPSGYSTKDAEPEQPSKIIEIARSLSSAGKPPA
jgi:hypothetical protein